MVNSCYLYIIKHKLKPIIYIGLSKDTKVRFREHKNDSSNSILKSYINEYGADAFTYTVLLEDTRSNIEELEELVILEAKLLDRLIVCNKLTGSVSTGDSCQKGSAHWNASISEKDVEDIRSIYSKGGITQKQIGEIYNLSNKVISKITSGERWSHVGTSVSNNLTNNKVANRRKLSDTQVGELRNLAQKQAYLGTLNMESLGQLYNVARGSIRLILNGISYAKLGGPIKGVDYV
jgi:predicted GIY-YIG superfamily endonuclease